MRRDGSRGFGLEQIRGTDGHIVAEPGGGVVRARSVKPHVEQGDQDFVDGIVEE